MSCEVHVRFCEGPAGKFRRSTLLLVHCKRGNQAHAVLLMIEKRLAQCKLELHPEKTRIVYCKDDDRRKKYPIDSFDFLGYTFRPRRAKNKDGKFFVSFLPAISNKAKKAIRETIRGWRLHLITWTTLEDIAERVNPIIRGWHQYYGRFYQSEMSSVLQHVEMYLVRWVRWKYKKLSCHRRKAVRYLRYVHGRTPGLFAHWARGFRLAVD